MLRLFYDLSVYAQIVSDSLWKNIGRFLFAYLLLAIGYSFFASIKVLPPYLNQVQEAAVAINQTLPEDAIFTMNDFNLSVSQLNQPFIIGNYLLIDTQSSSALASTSALIALGPTHMLITDTDQTSEIIFYQELNLPNFSYTGSHIKDQLSQINRQIDAFRPYLPAIILIPLYLLLILARIFPLILYSLIFTLISSFFRSNYRFIDFLKITLNTIIVAETINLIILVIYHHLYPTIFSLAFIGTSILVYFNLPPKTQLPPQKNI